MGTAEHDLSIRPLARMVEANLAEHYAYLGHAPGAELADEGDLLWVITGVMSATQNGVVRARLGHLTPAALGARIDQVLRRFRDRRVYMSWWVGPATEPPEIGAHLEAHGMPAGRVPGMAADLVTLNEPPAAPGLAVVPVTDEAALWRWVGVHGHDFSEADRRAHIELYAGLGLSHRLPWRHDVGRRDGKPVGASSLFLGGGAAGIYNVATVPEARRQGIGTAMTLAPLRQARAEGYRVGVLQSSAAGASVYRRLGFGRCCWMGQHCLVLG
jgi:ribosomal protein S18 acetylase RimI-like enzyme